MATVCCDCNIDHHYLDCKQDNTVSLGNVPCVVHYSEFVIVIGLYLVVVHYSLGHIYYLVLRSLRQSREPGHNVYTARSLDRLSVHNNVDMALCSIFLADAVDMENSTAKNMLENAFGVRVWYKYQGRNDMRVGAAVFAVCHHLF